MVIIVDMVLSLSISAEAEARLRMKAAAAGVDVETYTTRQIERMAIAPKSLQEISGPIAESFAETGMTEDELSDFLEAEKHAMRAERMEKRAE
jgi:hypothetical protein